MSHSVEQKKSKGNFSKIKNYGQDILEDVEFLNSKNCIQHGTVSVMEHSIAVAQCALSISEKLPFSFCERELVRGALLHDYFLYDWHLRESITNPDGSCLGNSLFVRYPTPLFLKFIW